MKDNREKVIIVGAGMAGLTAAAYLCQENYDVLVFEKNDITGGLVSTFERDGFFFDSGPRAFVNSGMVRPILTQLGLSLEEENNTISMAIEDKIFKIESLQSLSDFEEILKELFPEDKSDIEKIMKIIYKLSKHTEVLYEFDNPYFVDYTSNKKVLFFEFIPWLIRLSRSLRAFNKYNMPMEDYLGKITNNQSLIDMLTQFFFEETPTHFALGYFHVYLDYFYPSKGTGQLPKIVYKKVVEDGGNIKLNTTITEVFPNEKLVKDHEGNEYKYDYLIWASDLKTFYNQVNDKNLDNDLKQSFETQKQRILKATAAESVYVMYLGVDRPASYFRNITTEHMFYTPSKRGLNDLAKSKKKELLENFESLSKEEVLSWVDDYCDYNTFEISIPSLRDSSLAPENQTSMMVSFLFDYEITTKIEEEGYAEEFKNRVENRVLDLLSNGIFKNINEDIKLKFSFTPGSISRYTGNSEGGIVGWSFVGEAPVYSKLKDLAKAVYTPFNDIYQASQWAFAPAGVPIAMLTAWHATEKIKKKTKTNKKRLK